LGQARVRAKWRSFRRVGTGDSHAKEALGWVFVGNLTKYLPVRPSFGCPLRNLRNSVY
jgi:hypothetical protein